MHCSNCGGQIDDNAVVCPKCGCATNDSNVSGGQIPADISTAKTLGILAIVLGILAPVIGLVCGYIGKGKAEPYCDEYPEADDAFNKCEIGIKIGWALIVIGIIGSIIYGVAIGSMI